uniref:Pentatricopeptide repeat-containing protein n=1 Tax=Kalanchoe fedtschenkoi TaxID=63787 RepID=A0A7N0TS18_KALFE
MKCGIPSNAWRVFSSMPCKDTAVWNSMISGLGRAGLFIDALSCFRNMLEEGVKVDYMTMPSILKACGHDGHLMKGKELHGQIIKCSKYQDDMAIGNSMIDMYSKCGCFRYSEKVFENMRDLNIVSWTTMMSCYGSHGKGHESLKIYKNMGDAGFKPNCITLTALLSSCSHAGLINEGRAVFYSFIHKYGFEPRVEHFACMVDLLGRCGHIEEAFQLIKDEVSIAMASAWGALLASCVMHKNIEIGRIAACHLFKLEPKNTSNYIALCTIYKSLGMRNEFSETRSKIRELSLVKSPGYSWINIAGEIHKFYQGDLSHPFADIIYEVLDGMTATLTMPRRCG